MYVLSQMKLQVHDSIRLLRCNICVKTDETAKNVETVSNNRHVRHSLGAAGF